MDNGLQFKVKRIYRLEGNGNTKAFVDLVINDELLIKGLRVVNGKEGLFVSMPREQGKDSKWYDTVQPMKKEIKEQISMAILNAYKNDQSNQRKD
jgi:stage V sporulation protein G